MKRDCFVCRSALSDPRYTIRNYRSDDCKEISGLFYETVHTVNAKDYSREQLCAWAHGSDQLLINNDKFLKQKTFIAESDGAILGFASIDGSGYLDMLFVHKDFQRRGIATALCNEAEKDFSVIKTFASVTAKPFFEKRGYVVTGIRESERSGITLKSFEMQKIKQ